MEAAVNLNIRSLLVLALFLAIPITIFVLIVRYVYKDAKRRHMNASLWTLVAVLAPFFIGFVLYLLARSNHPDLICPKCGASVSDQYTVCPQCGTQLQPACPQCNKPVDPSWKYCPWCTAPLDGIQQPTPPQPRPDKFLLRLLVAILLVPIFLMSLSVFAMVNIRQSGVSTLSRYYLVVGTYYTEVPDDVAESVRQWYEGLELNLNHAYVLEFDEHSSLDNLEHQYFLVYAPKASGDGRFGIHNGFLRSTVELKFDDGSQPDGFALIEVKATKHLDLDVYVGGKKRTVDVQTVDFNPTTLFRMPNFADSPSAAALPERFKITRFVDGENAGILEVGDPETMQKILSAIDSAPRVPIESAPTLDSNETPLRFHITVQYTMGDPETEATFLLYQDGDAYYLQDDRVENTADGSSIREMSADFCRYLEHLFADAYGAF